MLAGTLGNHHRLAPYPLVEQCSKVSHGGICAAPHRQMHPTLWMTEYKSAILDVFCLLLLKVTFAVFNQQQQHGGMFLWANSLILFHSFTGSVNVLRKASMRQQIQGRRRRLQVCKYECKNCRFHFSRKVGFANIQRKEMHSVRFFDLKNKDHGHFLLLFYIKSLLQANHC